MSSTQSFYRPREVANILKIDYKKVLQLIQLGEIPAHQIGNQYRIPQPGLHEFLRQTKVKGLAI